MLELASGGKTARGRGGRLCLAGFAARVAAAAIRGIHLPVCDNRPIPVAWAQRPRALLQGGDATASRIHPMNPFLFFKLPDTPAVPAPFLPMVLWAKASLMTMQMLAASAQVIGQRTSRMALAGPMPGARDRAENTLMVTEKIDAFSNAGMRAMRTGMALQGELAKLWMSGLSASPGEWQKHMAQSQKLSAQTARAWADVMQPLHAKATANARRLSRPRR